MGQVSNHIRIFDKHGGSQPPPANIYLRQLYYALITPRLLNLEGTHAGKKSTRLQRSNPTTNPWIGYKYLRSYSTAGKLPFSTPKKLYRLSLDFFFSPPLLHLFLILLLFIFFINFSFYEAITIQCCG